MSPTATTAKRPFAHLAHSSVPIECSSANLEHSPAPLMRSSAHPERSSAPLARPPAPLAALVLLLPAMAAGCFADSAPALIFDAAAPADLAIADLAPATASADFAAAAPADLAPAADLAGVSGSISGGSDTDVALVRFAPDGTLDDGFGVHGIARIDFAPGIDSARDTLWSIAADAQGGFILSGAKKGAGARVDLDRVVARVTAAGALDGSFATAGQYTFNLSGLNDQPKTALVQPDGKVVSLGFTAMPTGVGTQTTDLSVLVRLWGGATDPTFGASGLATLVPFIPATPATTQWGLFEPGAVARQSTGAFVTVGYGRTTPSNDYNVVALRHTPDGVPDTTFASNGIVQLDVAKQTDRGRNLAVLPDDRFVVAGTSAPRANVTHSLLALFGANGVLDTSFNGNGYKVYDFGLPSEEFYGVALSPSGNWIAAAGFRTAGGQNDDATLALVPLAGGGSEFAAPTPLSVQDDDRFWAVAFDAQDRVYATGYVIHNGDGQMALARFTTDGALDPTFGTGGIVTVNVTYLGGTLEMARSLVIQPDGKIVIAGDCEH